MKTTDLSFEIAEITFRYIYASEIEISDDATIHNFLISKQEKYDVINHVEICKNLVEECIVDEEPAFKAPAWTLYDSFVYFIRMEKLLLRWSLAVNSLILKH